MSVRFDASTESYTRAISLGAITQYSIACWLKISVDRNALSAVWSLDNSFASAYGLLQTNTDGTTLLYSDGSANRTLGALTVGTWCHVGISVNGVNGTAVLRRATDTSATVTTWSDGDTSINADTLRICASVFAGQFLNGCVAAFKMWTGAGATLSQAELEAETWTYMPQRTSGMRAWYPFLTASTVDYSGINSTLSGGTGTTSEDGPPIAWRSRRPSIYVPPQTAVTGGLAATLPPLTAGLTGDVQAAGQVAAQLPTLVANATAIVGVGGDLAATLPPITAALTGSIDTAGVLAATLPTLTGSLTGTVEANVLNATLPPLAANLTAVAAVEGILNAQLPILAGALTGETEIPANDVTFESSGPVRGWAAGAPGSDWASGDSARAWGSSTAARSWNADGAARGWSARPPTT